MSMTAPILPDDGMLSDEEFARVAGLLRQFTGIDLKRSKRSMSSVRISRLLKTRGAEDLGAFLMRLQRADAQADRDAFINALTTNVTRFNREAHQFDHLSREVLPALSAAMRRGARVRLWSAGCSSGEEAYDLAFRVLEACPEAARLDCRILGTDINREVLREACRGQYEAEALSDLPRDYLGEHFKSLATAEDTVGAPGRKVVHGPARDLVVFRHLNLQADWPFGGLFDVIMCRNVTIYFDADTQKHLWQRFAERLAPEGVLYVGHSETLHPDIAPKYQLEGPSIFRKSPIAAGTANPGTALFPQTRHDHEHQG